STYKAYLELAVYIDYDYQPEEAPQGAYPGCSAEVTINSVQIQGQDIGLTSSEQEEIKAEILEHRTRCLQVEELNNGQ
ncbi:unnamed protein product, partial [marine sediment metagenome]